MTLDIEAIKGMMDGLDPAVLLPDVSSIVGKVELICRFAILIAPILLVIMGIIYLLFAPKEANHYMGYRTTFGMGSVSAWRHTQKVAGFLFLGVGAVLTLIMLMTSATFGGMEATDMVWRAFRCLIWEAVFAIALNTLVGTIAAMTFDYKGNKRRKK